MVSVISCSDHADLLGHHFTELLFADGRVISHPENKLTL